MLTDLLTLGTVTTKGMGADKEGEFQWCFSILSHVRFSFPLGSPDCSVVACSVLSKSLLALNYNTSLKDILIKMAKALLEDLDFLFGSVVNWAATGRSITASSLCLPLNFFE